MPNILITSAGRRGVLIRLFQDELKKIDPDAKVFATDLVPELSSACQIADGCFKVPRVTDQDYIPTLKEICQDNEIELIIPTIDTELLTLAENKDTLCETEATPVISKPDLVSVCRDKRKTHDFFVKAGLRSPTLMDPGKNELTYPVFAKPYDGSCSINTHLLNSESDLTPSLLADPKLIYLQYLSPQEHDEFTVDMYYGREGLLKCLVPRLRIETRAGEVSKGRTVWIPALNNLRDRMRQIDSARGCLTVQVFVNRANGDLFGIEINPRFGGGYPLSYEAGANYPKWLLQEYLHGKTIDWFDEWERDLTMLRYDEHVVVRNELA